MLAEKTKRKRTTYSPATIAKAKALYIVKGLGPTEICAQTAVPHETLSNWIARGKWVSERKARQLRLERNAVARATDENAAFLESMATQAEELAEDGMELARVHVKSASDFAARNFQSATQGVKNVVDVYSEAFT
jgi:methyl-accepting chemotaxis protein